MPATRMMIARRAGVSVATVDRVLRDDLAVRPAMRLSTPTYAALALPGKSENTVTTGTPALLSSSMKWATHG